MTTKSSQTVKLSKRVYNLFYKYYSRIPFIYPNLKGDDDFKLEFRSCIEFMQQALTKLPASVVGHVMIDKNGSIQYWYTDTLKSRRVEPKYKLWNDKKAYEMPKENKWFESNMKMHFSVIK